MIPWCGSCETIISQPSGQILTILNSPNSHHFFQEPHPTRTASLGKMPLEFQRHHNGNRGATTPSREWYLRCLQLSTSTFNGDHRCCRTALGTSAPMGTGPILDAKSRTNCSAPRASRCHTCGARQCNRSRLPRTPRGIGCKSCSNASNKLGGGSGTVATDSVSEEESSIPMSNSRTGTLALPIGTSRAPHAASPTASDGQWATSSRRRQCHCPLESN